MRTAGLLDKQHRRVLRLVLRHRLILAETVFEHCCKPKCRGPFHGHSFRSLQSRRYRQEDCATWQSHRRIYRVLKGWHEGNRTPDGNSLAIAIRRSERYAGEQSVGYLSSYAAWLFLGAFRRARASMARQLVSLFFEGLGNQVVDANLVDFDWPFLLSRRSPSSLCGRSCPRANVGDQYVFFRCS